MMISRLMIRYKNLSFRNKLLLSYVVCILVPILILSVILSVQSSHAIRVKALGTAEQSLSKAVQGFDDIISEADRIAHTLDENRSLRELLDKDPALTGKSEQIEDYAYIQNLIASLQAGSRAYSIRLYVPDDWIYTNQERITLPMSNLERLPMYQHIFENKALCFGDVLRMSYVFGDTVRVLPVVYPIYSTQDYKRLLAVVRLDYTVDLIVSVIEEADFTASGAVALVNKNGEICISSNKAPYYHSVFTLALSSDHAVGEWAELSHEKQLIITGSALQANGWKLIAVIPLANLMREANALRTTTWIVTSVLGLLLVLIAIATSGYNSKRIFSLARSMNRMMEGDLSVQETIDCDDEIGLLQRSFNDTVNRVKVMIQERYELGQNIKNLELVSLQSQINPHFLYNILDFITWSARDGHNDEIIRMTEALSRYYRISLSSGSNYISLQNECIHVALYVEILNQRLHNSVNLTIDLPEELQEFVILKLTLQPLVENAILHGILQRQDKHGNIAIQCRREEEALHIKVEDDGVGVIPARLQSLENAPPHEGYGIWNIRQRLSLHYGKQAHLWFEGKQQGLIVHVRLPLCFDEPLHNGNPAYACPPQ